MHFRRCYVSVCTSNEKIYAMGGYDGHSRLKSAEVYSPDTNQWTLLPDMNVRRSDADACSLDDKIYITGLLTIKLVLLNIRNMMLILFIHKEVSTD